MKYFTLNYFKIINYCGQILWYNNILDLADSIKQQ